MSKTDPERFIQSLFEPLPADEEPVMSRSFRLACSRDAKRAWRAAHRLWKAARCMNDAFRHMRDPSLARDFARIGFQAVDPTSEHVGNTMERRAVDYLIRTPAPTKADVALKKRLAAEWKKPDPEWEAAIAADEARLAGRVKLGVGARP